MKNGFWCILKSHWGGFRQEGRNCGNFYTILLAKEIDITSIIHFYITSGLLNNIFCTFNIYCAPGLFKHRTREYNTVKILIMGIYMCNVLFQLHLCYLCFYWLCWRESESTIFLSANRLIGLNQMILLCLCLNVVSWEQNLIIKRRTI